jgi:hypothetical protein
LAWVGLDFYYYYYYLAEKFTFAGSELISIGSGSVNFGCFLKNKN